LPTFPTPGPTISTGERPLLFRGVAGFPQSPASSPDSLSYLTVPRPTRGLSSFLVIYEARRPAWSAGYPCSLTAGTAAPRSPSTSTGTPLASPGDCAISRFHPVPSRTPSTSRFLESQSSLSEFLTLAQPSGLPGLQAPLNVSAVQSPPGHRFRARISRPSNALPRGSILLLVQVWRAFRRLSPGSRASLSASRRPAP